MCGISGILTSPGHPDNAKLADAATAMAACLTHRGPDDRGAWSDAGAGIALAHRRLAVIDPSPSGHQPMLSRCGRFVLTYNGEIYNFRELRRLLAADGDVFEGHSDTEVILAAIARLGLETALNRFHGMFALALWDREERTLYLARDRIGQKPLYYGRMDGRFVFMSELKALAGLGARPAIERGAVGLFLRYGYVPGPRTTYHGVYKLPAGTWFKVRAGDSADAAKPRHYWSVADAARAGRTTPIATAEAAADALHATLGDTVGERLVADVPLGMFLSGGIDSSLVAALMQARSGRPIRTFSVGFTERQYNEAHHARQVAAHLGTEHTELTVGPDDMLDAVTRMGDIYDEPFADSSQVPTFLLCRLVRKHLTVALTGDGGDELFFGYRRYLRARRAARYRPLIPRRLRMGLGRWLAATSQGEDRRARLAADLLAPSLPHFYRNRLAKWQHPEAVAAGATEVDCRFDTDMAEVEEMPFAEAMLLLDIGNELCDDMMVKVDRASMAVGLEARSPLLDHRVVELAWRIPLEFKFRDGRTKWLLREVLTRYVPRELIDRPKMGFGAPIRGWLRSPALRDWCENLLAPERLAEDGIFDPRPIRAMWSALQRGEGHWHSHLWYVLMFQAWREAESNRYASTISESQTA